MQKLKTNFPVLITITNLGLYTKQHKHLTNIYFLYYLIYKTINQPVKGEDIFNEIFTTTHLFCFDMNCYHILHVNHTYFINI